MMKNDAKGRGTTIKQSGERGEEPKRPRSTSSSQSPERESGGWPSRRKPGPAPKKGKGDVDENAFNSSQQQSVYDYPAVTTTAVTTTRDQNTDDGDDDDEDQVLVGEEINTRLEESEVALVPDDFDGDLLDIAIAARDAILQNEYDIHCFGGPLTPSLSEPNWEKLEVYLNTLDLGLRREVATGSKTR